MKNNEYLEILSLHENYTEDDLKRAYRIKVLEFHPDKNIGDEEKAAEKLKKVIE